jgi:hypothetical protein
LLALLQEELPVCLPCIRNNDKAACIGFKQLSLERIKVLQEKMSSEVANQIFVDDFDVRYLLTDTLLITVIQKTFLQIK